MSKLHDKHFPNESPEYRKARNKLLEAEIELRRKTEAIAKMRRKLPTGGKIKEDYIFDGVDKNGKVIQIKLSELFKPGKDTVVLYSFMYGPDDKAPCPMCSSFIDGMNSVIFHAKNRLNFAVVVKAPVGKIAEWAEGRKWKNIRVLSSGSNSYNTDYFGETETGSQMPMLNVFSKTTEGMFHFSGSEMLFTPSEEGQHRRHLDSIWPMWNLFDYTPEGRGTNWFPKYSYE